MGVEVTVAFEDVPFFRWGVFVVTAVGPGACVLGGVLGGEF